MNRHDLTPETLDAIAAQGFDVYQCDKAQTYCFYTDGVRIAYLQNDRLTGFTISTVNIPNLYSGTGFSAGDFCELDRETLERGFMFAPHWADRSRLESVKKYKDAAAWLAAQRILTYTRVRQGAPRLIETTERAAYWQLRSGVYQATAPDALPPALDSGYHDLDALKRLKGDSI